MLIFRNLVLINLLLFLIGWYFWGVRYNLDTTPMIYATIVLMVNTGLAWWVLPRQQNSAYFLLGNSIFIVILNFILLRGLVTLR